MPSPNKALDQEQARDALVLVPADRRPRLQDDHPGPVLNGGAVTSRFRSSAWRARAGRSTT